MANPETLAVGDIVMSVLSEPRFLEAHGGHDPFGKNPKWVLCDGRRVPHDSAYASDCGPTVPDLVGRYPRGEDLTGKTGIRTLPVSETMDDTVVSHKHKFTSYKAEADNGTGFLGSTFWSNSGGQNEWGKEYESSTPIELPAPVQVASETRPKTTILNFFIRIN